MSIRFAKIVLKGGTVFLHLEEFDKAPGTFSLANKFSFAYKSHL